MAAGLETNRLLDLHLGYTDSEAHLLDIRVDRENVILFNLE